MLNALIIGANGQIGQHLARKMQTTNTLHPIAMVRKEEQKSKFEELGVETTLADLEGSIDEIARAAKNAEAIVFTAGSGSHTGADKTIMVDLDGAIKAMEAAKQVGIKRFVMVSAIGVRHRDRWLPTAPHYSAAKYYADLWLENSGLDYTIIRPGKLTDEPGTGKVSVALDLERGEIPREDVAAAIIASLQNKRSIGKTFDIVSGKIPIQEAIDSL